MPLTGPPAVDFYSQLSGLGDTLQANAKLAQQNQLMQNRKDAFSSFTSLDPNSPDYGKQAMTIAQKLGSNGDPDGAMKFITIAQTAADKARQAQNDAFSHDIQTKQLALSRRAADRADDPTPDNFVKDPTAPGGYRPIGPAAPEYKANVAEAEAKAKGNVPTVMGMGSALIIPNKAADGPIFTNKAASGVTLDDDAVKSMASQYLAGDRTVKQNIGKGIQGSEDLRRLNNEIYRQANEQGLDGKAIVNQFNEQAGAAAGQRTVGTRAANISLAANEANNMIPIALDASAKVPRGQWMPINQAIQAYQKGSSSPELASFVAATNSLVNAYVRAVSPSGVPTDSMRQHAYDMLNSAQGPDAYAAVVSTMQKEMQAALQAPSMVRKELKTQNAGGESTPQQPSSNTTGLGVKWSVQ